MTMPTKRRLVHDDEAPDRDDGCPGTRPDANPNHPSSRPVSKRLRTMTPRRTRDIISTLSDELLIRILSFVDEKTLLGVSPVSRRFSRITSDSQLWRPHYYRRFILPRAHMIPGFRTGFTRSSSKLRYSTGKTIWADGGWGRRGGFVSGPRETAASDTRELIDWKKQYKLRHNWARGACAVDEVQVRRVERDTPAAEWQTMVKVVDGLAVTVDGTAGIRAWDLKTRRLIAQADLGNDKETNQPSCLAVDDLLLNTGRLDVAVGFEDGTFSLWELNVKSGKIGILYQHAKNYFGELVAIAYGHPYIFTASRLGFVSLFSFDHPQVETAPIREHSNTGPEGRLPMPSSVPEPEETAPPPRAPLTQPRLLTSLKSHTTGPPLALSVRRMTTSVVASIAYTFDAVGGWSIGIQDLDIRPSGFATPDIVTSRVAYTLPTQTRLSATSSPPSSPSNSRARSPAPLEPGEDGPIRLCYSHPYLLATLPDNTLVLHLCTSTASSLSISPGIRLWGHTSGISDAEITPRGKAVSISTRGDEIRVWELEGRVGGSSVELRPRQSGDDAEQHVKRKHSATTRAVASLDDTKSWVGFDEEMVVVLKEARDGRESLMVYDFT
ncbi:F-box domain containing protein [Metarhizium album ARSEF 1941]|uniref:F-box domain containing protein n=1 Tax=Metarhizium album (strain ARSEF 1941) TaxID=1081103 RepID=A0A0B2WN48_METAS|nr:F-box domain containing protein [Metarhizium album ARSEF 1941]KHN94435.1 F-box domain containing protein [Metarhizium album ARSEF 1941]